MAIDMLTFLERAATDITEETGIRFNFFPVPDRRIMVSCERTDGSWCRLTSFKNPMDAVRYARLMAGLRN